MDKYLKLLPLSLLFLYGSKLLVVGATLADAPVLLILGALTAFYELKMKNSQMDELSALKESLEKNSKEIEELRGHVGSIKLGQQVRLTR